MASPALAAAVAGGRGRVCLLKTPNRFVRYKLAPPASTLCRNDVDCHGAAFGATEPSLRSHVELQLEVLALRQQIQVLERSHRSRPRLSRADRVFWVWLSRVWTGWRNSAASITDANGGLPESLCPAHDPPNDYCVIENHSGELIVASPISTTAAFRTKCTRRLSSTSHSPRSLRLCGPWSAPSSGCATDRL
jgi:hypothetical protein